MSNIVITKPTLNDVDTMFEWGDKNWELWGDSEFKWLRKEDLASWVENPRDDVLLVAKIDGKLVGMCLNYNLRCWSYCASLYIDIGYRNIGIAKQLVDEAINQLQSYGVEQLVFLVDEKNTEGMKFYQKINCKEGFHFIWMYKDVRKGGA